MTKTEPRTQASLETALVVAQRAAEPTPTEVDIAAVAARGSIRGARPTRGPLARFRAWLKGGRA